jgi:hypothetical protein
MAVAPKLLYTRAESAAMLSLCLSSIDQLINQGKLPAIRKGRRVFIQLAELQYFADHGTDRIWLPKQNGKTVGAKGAAYAKAHDRTRAALEFQDRDADANEEPLINFSMHERDGEE